MCKKRHFTLEAVVVAGWNWGCTVPNILPETNGVRGAITCAQTMASARARACPRTPRHGPRAAVRDLSFSRRGSRKATRSCLQDSGEPSALTDDAARNGAARE